MGIYLGKRRDDIVCIEDIKFADIPHVGYKNRTSVETHIEGADVDKFEVGDYVYAENVDNNYCFEITYKKICKSVTDLPYSKNLSSAQVKHLESGVKFAYIKLTKTKYERPYKMSYIKEHYPEKVYEALKKDKVHSWRAKTGIELIHLEPDNAEQTRVWHNWGFMSEYLKKESDKKCVEIFGVPNKEHYDIVSNDKMCNDDSDFKFVVDTYKSKYGFDLSKIKLVLSKTPRHVDGKIVTNPDPIVKKGFAGCYTDEGRVYLNPDQKTVMENYGITDVEVSDFKRHILAHELGHVVYAHLATDSFKEKILKCIEDEEFTTPYLDEVRKTEGGAKIHKEAFCEYMAYLICGDKLEISTEALKDKKDGEDSPKITKIKKFLEELNRFKRSNNCQKFAAALELKFRGKSREVTPTPTPFDRCFDVPKGKASPLANWCIVKNAKFESIDAEKPSDKVKEIMLKYGEGSRAIIAVTWKGGRGHVFNLTVVDGEVYLMDATANRLKKVDDSDYLTSKTDGKKSLGIIRTDNATIDEDMEKATFEEEERKFFLTREDGTVIKCGKQKSVLAFLNLFGKKNTKFNVTHDGKEYGKILCLDIETTYGKEWTVWNYKWL